MTFSRTREFWVCTVILILWAVAVGVMAEDHLATLRSQPKIVGHCVLDPKSTPPQTYIMHCDQ